MKQIWGEVAPYYSQRNNLNVPGRACGVTSIINALAAAGIPFPGGPGQPEDRLYDLILTDPECRKLYTRLDPMGRYPINEWQDILALGANIWLKNPKLFRFRDRATSGTILEHLRETGPCIVTGEFPMPEGKVLHHTVALIGYETDDEYRPELVTRWFIRDPWGDHRTLYRIKHGALVDLTAKEFSSILKVKNSPKKWCIYLDTPL